MKMPRASCTRQERDLPLAARAGRDKRYSSTLARASATCDGPPTVVILSARETSEAANCSAASRVALGSDDGPIRPETRRQAQRRHRPWRGNRTATRPPAGRPTTEQLRLGGSQDTGNIGGPESTQDQHVIDNPFSGLVNVL